jgi:hypothetical protein
MAENEWVRRFSAQLQRPDGVGTWTYVNVPFDAQTAFGARGQIHVRGTVNGAAFRSSLMPQGDGRHYLVVGAELRTKAGVVLGDSVDVEVRPDTEERVVIGQSDGNALTSG